MLDKRLGKKCIWYHVDDTYSCVPTAVVPDGKYTTPKLYYAHGGFDYMPASHVRLTCELEIILLGIRRQRAKPEPK